MKTQKEGSSLGDLAAVLDGETSSVTNQGQRSTQAVRHKPHPLPNTGKGQLMGTASLQVPKVLLKFGFMENTHRHLIPVGITDKGNHDSRGTAGYRDDGVQPIAVHGVDASVARIALTNNGFRLVDASFTRKPEGKHFKVTVSMEFRKEPESVKLSGVANEGLRALLTQTWLDCYVWENPETEKFGEASVTINLRTPVSSQPRVAITTKDGELSVESF